MHPGIRVEMYIWERRRQQQLRAGRGRQWQDPDYQMQRQTQLDRGKILGRIYLGIAILVGISYIFFP